jgi:hypothetical protein
MSEIKKVFIEKHKDGEWLNEYSFKAFEGFEKLGIETDAFIAPGLVTPPYKDGVPISKDYLYVGSWSSLSFIINDLDLDVPQYDYYPAVEKQDQYEYDENDIAGPTRILKRDIYSSTFREVYDQVTNTDASLFVKPKQHKVFTGFKASSEKDFISLEDVDDDQKVWVSDIIEDIISEFRVFVHRGEIVSVQYYMGNRPTVFPDKDFIHFVKAKIEEREDINAYCFDIGINKHNDNFLIECNDFYAIGCYGLHSTTYAKMLLDRWEQILD